MIPIRNVYHMLAYAFQSLDSPSYGDLAVEKFENTADLFAAILARGIASQLKRGIRQEYKEKTGALSALRGKIEIAESIKSRSILNRQLVCSLDDFSADTLMNRILKTTCVLLLRADIERERRDDLRRLLWYFSDVGDVDLARVKWSRMRFDRNNQTYRMLMGICRLVAEGLLQTQENGPMRLADFLDDQRMSHLYEKFVLNYYRREWSELHVSSPRIEWVLDDNQRAWMLPAMQADIMLSHECRILIIDTKFYGHATLERYDRRIIHSSNLYQIFSYVKNKAAQLVGSGQEVAGMLLYAGTDEDEQPIGDFKMSGNLISVRSLDLNCPFVEIRHQLDKIAEN